MPQHVQPNLHNKVAVVTGGAGVLGSTMCRALAACGAKVAILGRDLAKAEALASDIRSTGGTALAVACDVLQRDTLLRAAEEIKGALGLCDILINGAGGNHPRGVTAQEYVEDDTPPTTEISHSTPNDFFALDPQGFQFVLDLNLMGSFLPSQVFGEQMLGRGGNILNISSMSAYRPLTKVPAYSSAKAAISNFTQWLAVHFGQAGIRVNALAPGFFITEQNRQLMLDAHGEFTPRAQKVIAQTPMRRFGEAQELIGALLWLVNNETAGFVTGAIIPVDGGFSAYTGV